MERVFDGRQQWALILGGSSGIGLATAKKLASLGMNIAIVHRDRRGAMVYIDKEFEDIRDQGVGLQVFNTNALTEDGRQQIIDALKGSLGAGRVRLLLHSIALGNLKLLAPYHQDEATVVEQLASSLGIDAPQLKKTIAELYAEGASELAGLVSAPRYDNDRFAGDDDFYETIYNMGTSLVTWTRDLFEAGLFAGDSRVVGLTSEGNRIAWRGYAPVSAAKAVLESVSRAIAVEFAPYGVRSNILQPGVTDTPALRMIPGHEAIKAQARQRNPMRRLTTPQDVANVVALLCTDEAAWINGAVIRVDGGEGIGG